MNAQFYLTVMLCVCIAAIAYSPISYRRIKREYDNRLTLDITITQMIELEGRLCSFLREKQLQPGAELRTIAQALGIVEDGESCQMPNRATLGKPKDDGTLPVSFRADLSAMERRFDFAHECAHRINHDPVPATRPDGYNKPESEQLADYMAAAILMPLDAVYQFLISQQYLTVSTRKKTRIIRMLCNQYHVSEIIALRRVREVFAVKKAQEQQ